MSDISLMYILVHIRDCIHIAIGKQKISLSRRAIGMETLTLEPLSFRLSYANQTKSHL
uniref:Uncharacterized protein n=1 Tax=Kalanchoe fedtschenkoi TaxID=63787 RepID=A0A7N0SX72_KALFE